MKARRLLPFPPSFSTRLPLPSFPSHSRDLQESDTHHLLPRYLLSVSVSSPSNDPLSKSFSMSQPPPPPSSLLSRITGLFNPPPDSYSAAPPASSSSSYSPQQQYHHQQQQQQPPFPYDASATISHEDYFRLRAQQGDRPLYADPYDSRRAQPPPPSGGGRDYGSVGDGRDRARFATAQLAGGGGSGRGRDPSPPQR